jgi:imidazolonepropionase-like amidohydrolase
MTLNGARYLGREAEVGSIAVDKRADLIAFAKPMAVSGSATPEIVWSMKAGRAFDRARILGMWQRAVGLR